MVEVIRKVPHLMFGPDGNRRYAKKEKISFSESYDLAARKVAEVVDWCFSDGITDELSLWVLEEYNLQRPKEEVQTFTKAIADCFKYIINSKIVKSEDLQIKIVGNLDLFFNNYEGSRSEFESLARKVGENKGKRINFLSPYDGRKELNSALQLCLEETIEPSFENLSQRGNISPVSMFLRTGQPSGFRLSDYYPGIFQARLVSTPLYPAELDKDEFLRLINSVF